MNKICFTLGICLMLLAPVFGQKAITLENIWQDYTFIPESVPGFTFMNDGQHYTRLENNKIQKYDLRTGKLVATLLDAGTLPDISEIGAYRFTEDESKIVLSNNAESIYRHSFTANFFVYDRESNQLTAIFPGGAGIRLAALNPQGTKAAFVQANNLYIKDLNTGKIEPVTTDGEINKIINGATDWVYEEEFGDDNGFFWSPDGQQLAYYRFDESAVREFTLTNYHDGSYPDYVTFKYPKVGEKNSEVSIHIYDLASGKTREVAKTGPEWEYFPRIKWTRKAGELCVFFMNRHQSKLELRLLNFAGTSRTLLSESSPYYIDIHDNLYFLKTKDQFIWTSELAGWNHAYLYNMDGSLAEQLTTGQWDITQFYGLDEANGTIYYQAAKQNPAQREIYSQELKGRGGSKMLASEAGTNKAQFSSTFDYFVLTFSTQNTPPTYTVLDRQSKRVRLIEENEDLRSLQQTYGVQPVTFFNFKTSEDIQLNGYMIKPPNFNEKMVYPVLMYVYGGPGSQTVNNAWGGQNYWWFQMLAQQGYIIVSVDNRGTGARGEQFKKMTYQRLGYYETIDQTEAAKYLGRLGYVDARRIGIFGWSYGGYMASSCILKSNDVFKAAIAVAPVTNWKWYDSIYTERYMRTVEENEEGYRQHSPVYFADQLKGSYLLVHGMGDDNVHFQNTAEMANALIMANKQFDTYFYPNRNHGISGGPTRLHLYTRMTDFLNEKLKAKPNVTGRPAGLLRAEPMQKTRE
ncbi:MAG: S9 family peptidase [Bacteroidetes bacterium]|nr:MAG: S9 family peptidase [Bacteroidota bacterium]PTM11127.1 MAG: S9 family peptidase [Bacteroidota bacterium]